ncbi:hypothetical protein [Desulfosporosinus youngiae]|nr:hypothetical protein [Desulfosporosinus youngiae]
MVLVIALFTSAVGLVVEVGGMMSHGSVMTAFRPEHCLIAALVKDRSSL